MADRIVQIEDLYDALSGFFVDNDIDYEYIASIAKNFPIDTVESVLFELVAPVCCTNLMTPIPTVWLFFDREELIKNIEKQKKIRLSASFLKKTKMRLKECYLRYSYSKEWNQLKLILNSPSIF